MNKSPQINMKIGERRAVLLREAASVLEISITALTIDFMDAKFAEYLDNRDVIIYDNKPVLKVY